jgi:hypothetical protein
MKAKWCTSLALLIMSKAWSVAPALALPPATDIPEEVLRTEIITEARSPIDGKLLTAEEYAELEAQLQEDARVSPEVAPRIRQLVGLLRLRLAIRRIFPFLLR